MNISESPEAQPTPQPPALGGGSSHDPAPGEPTYHSRQGPALAHFNGRLYLAWNGQNGVCYTFSEDGQEWEPPSQISIYGGVALAAFEGRLYLAGTYGNYPGRVWYTFSNDGQKWESEMQVPDAYTTHSPALAAFEGKLYLAWANSKDGCLWYTFTTYDGQHWEPPSQVIGGVWTYGSPALATFEGRLYLAWDSQTNVWYTFTTYDGQHWEPPFQVIGGADTIWRPALAAFKDELYLAWTNIKDGCLCLWYTFSDDGQREHWEPPSRVNGVSTNNDPALAAFEGKLYLAWTNAKDGCLWYTFSDDGRQWEDPIPVGGADTSHTAQAS